MDKLLELVKNKSWVDTGKDYNGSKIFKVETESGDESLTFWNDSNSRPIDCDNVCDLIVHLIADEGLDIQDNYVQDGWNSVEFELNGIY